MLSTLNRGPAWKKLLRNWMPPGIIGLAQKALNYVGIVEWECAPEGWRSAAGVRGWNIPSVVDFQKLRWKAYADALSGTSALTINHEEPKNLNSGKLRDHNTLVTYAYVLALAARQKQSVAVLDWGGGLGHYSLLSKSVLPDVHLEYYCHDLPLLCQAGREYSPGVRFVERRDDCFSRTYDLVLASSSLWYEEYWRGLVDELAAAANPYLYVTRMIFVDHASSYVAIQRPRADSYRTEYLCWILNRQEFIDHAHSRGMQLVREFVISDAQYIFKAPEQGSYKGFLFRKANARSLS